MFKVMILLKRKPGLSLEEFIKRYEGEHVPLAERHTTSLQGYIRHYLNPASHVVQGDVIEEPEYDVITELWYQDRAAFEQQQKSLRRRPEAIAAVIADEEALFDRTKSRTVYVDDHVSVLGGSMEDDLARSLRQLFDKDEIVDLVHRYSYYVDHRLYDELAELFTEDCVVDYGPGVAPPVRGRAAFRKMFGLPGGGFAATSHHNANVFVTFDDATAPRSAPLCTPGTGGSMEPRLGCGATTTTRCCGVRRDGGSPRGNFGCSASRAGTLSGIWR